MLLRNTLRPASSHSPPLYASFDRDAHRGGPPAPLPKVVVVGDMGVGKSQFLQTGIHSRPGEPFARMAPATTISFDFLTTVRDVGDHRTLRVNFVDTAGQEKFRALTATVFRDAEAIVFMYDVTDRPSLDAITEYWFPDVCAKFDGAPRLPLYFLIGTKTDGGAGQREVNYDEGAATATFLNAFYYETHSMCEDGAKARVTIDIIARTLVKNGVPTDAERAVITHRSNTVSLRPFSKKSKCPC